MIEFSRYTRLKPLGVVVVRIHQTETNQEPGVVVAFKRFDNETGKELDQAEECHVTFDELQQKADELERDLAVCRELLKLKV
jgi:hypothetical protein